MPFPAIKVIVNVLILAGGAALLITGIVQRHLVTAIVGAALAALVMWANVSDGHAAGGYYSDAGSAGGGGGGDSGDGDDDDGDDGGDDGGDGGDDGGGDA